MMTRRGFLAGAVAALVARRLPARAAPAYTLTRDLACSSIAVDPGVVVYQRGYHLYLGGLINRDVQ